MKITDKEADKLTTLLHYMKGVEPFSAILDYLLSDYKEWCAFTHTDVAVDSDCYHGNPSVQMLIAYIEKYVTCCHYLGCNHFAVGNIEQACRNLTVPERFTSVSDFEENVEAVTRSVAFIEADITDKLNRFTCLECERFDEAIECLQNCCFRASVVIAVSAVEARISEIVRRNDEDLYNSRFAKATLGQLIQLFDDKNTPKNPALSKLMPRKHKPLVDLLNLYRVFSAHPKEEKITLQIADSIVKLSFTFMIDPATCVYEIQELECS